MAKAILSAITLLFTAAAVVAGFAAFATAYLALLSRLGEGASTATSPRSATTRERRYCQVVAITSSALLLLLTLSEPLPLSLLLTSLLFTNLLPTYLSLHQLISLLPPLIPHYLLTTHLSTLHTRLHEAHHPAKLLPGGRLDWDHDPASLAEPYTAAQTVVLFVIVAWGTPLVRLTFWLARQDEWVDGARRRVLPLASVTTMEGRRRTN